MYGYVYSHLTLEYGFVKLLKFPAGSRPSDGQHAPNVSQPVQATRAGNRPKVGVGGPAEFPEGVPLAPAPRPRRRELDGFGTDKRRQGAQRRDP